MLPPTKPSHKGPTVCHLALPRHSALRRLEKPEKELGDLHPAVVVGVADSLEERLWQAVSCDQESSTALVDSHVPQLIMGEAHFLTRVGNTSEDCYHS